MGSSCDINFGSGFQKGEQFFFQKLDDGNDKKIELHFSLLNVKKSSENNSFDVTIINNTKLNIETYLGSLEERKGKNIIFGTSFKVSYYFQREQLLILDHKINGNLTGNKKSITLSELIRSSNKGNFYIIFKDVGKLLIQYKIYEEPDNLKIDISSFQFKIILENSIFLNELNLRESFFVIYIKDDNTKRPLYKSQEFNELKFYSNIINIPSNLLIVNNDKNTPLYFVLYCPHIKKDKNVAYGEFNFNQIENNSKMDVIPTIELKKKKCLTKNSFGKVVINYDKKSKITFFDYITKGMRINLAIAIDYTLSSNGPNNPIPLHNIDPRYPNDYEKAIESCGNIIATYNDDQLFPVYGFGGKPNGSEEVSHCFNINFKDDPNIKGIKNIIKTYKESLSKIELFGPTYFHHIIDKVIQQVKYDKENHKEKNYYYILLILTDGNMNDSKETRDKIIEASTLPISIIIVGIGGEKFDFELMKMLVRDIEPLLKSKGEPWKRDIVQFVDFNKFKIGNSIEYGIDLAEEVFKKIPRQVEEYYQKFGKFIEY